MVLITLKNDHKEMNGCLGSLNVGEFGEDGKYYYGLYDQNNKPHILFELEGKHLKQIKQADGDPPEPKYHFYVEEFAKSKDFILPLDEKNNVVASDTGLIKYDSEYYNVFDLPDNFNFDKGITLKNIKRPFKLNIERFYNSYSDLILDGSTGLISLDGIKYIRGNVDIRNTGITNIPKDFEMHNSAYDLKTDLGNFSELFMIIRARRAFKKHYEEQQKQLPAPDESSVKSITHDPKPLGPQNLSR